MRLTVTGAEGFVGGHLLPLLVERGHAVSGTYLYDHPEIADVSWHRADLSSRDSVDDLVSETCPEGIIHLAAISHVPDVQANPDKAFATNVTGLVHLLNAVGGGFCGTVVVVSSGEVYGHVPSDSLPLTEDHPIAPHNLYGVTKACSELVAWHFVRSAGMHVTVVRPFSQLGPGQADTFVCSSFARQVAQVMLDKAPPVVRVGNLTVRRDFMDVRDVVGAYAILVERFAGPGPFNLCSGTSVAIGDIVTILIEASGRDIEVDVDHSRVRSVDVPEMVGDPSAIRTATGWKPSRPVWQSLEDTLQYWVAEESRS